MLNENYIVNASAVVFRKDIFVKAGFAEETMRLCGDWLTHTKMLTLSDLAYVASPLNYFRTHSHSVRRTTGTLRAAREVAIVQSFIRSEYRIHGTQTTDPYGKLPAMARLDRQQSKIQKPKGSDGGLYLTNKARLCRL